MSSKKKGMIRSITEAVDDVEIADEREAADQEMPESGPAPTLDELDIVTAGTTITTDIPDFSDLDEPELVALPQIPTISDEPELGNVPTDDPEEEPEDIEDLEDPDADPTDPDPDPDSEEDEPIDEAEDWESDYIRKSRFKSDEYDQEVYGGMSKPGKMPCITYSTLAGGLHPNLAGRKGIDPEALKVRGTCPKGTVLAKQPGTVCYGCYAFGGNYLRANVINSLARRAKATRSALESPNKIERWVDAIGGAIERAGNDVFRWHDSGDILGLKHFNAIVQIARSEPNVRFWLPTKEHGTINNWLNTYGVQSLPKNLNVRMSAFDMFDVAKASRPLTTSSVASGEGFLCPATYDQEWKERYMFGTGEHRSPTCGPCRACWDRKVKNVDYGYHGAQSKFRHGLLTQGLLEPKQGGKVFVPPDKPKLWTPTPSKVKDMMKSTLPKSPGPVKKIIRPRDV